MPVGQHGSKQHGSKHGTGRTTRAAGGHNHGRAPRAIARALAAALLAAAPAWTLAVPPAHAQAVAEDNPLVQRGVPAEATAENAVVARDRALAAGQRIAYDRMAGQLGLPRGLSDSQIEALVSSLVIESERITPRGYSARITVNFNPQRVAGRAPGGAAPGPSGPAFGTPAPGAASPGGPAVATLEAVARYRSLPEWAEITRRLNASPAVARAEVVTVSGEMARIRLALRSQPPDAAAELAQGGLLLGPAAMDARPGEGWRLALAGYR
jgi:hypothetical protein